MNLGSLTPKSMLSATIARQLPQLSERSVRTHNVSEQCYYTWLFNQEYLYYVFFIT